MVQSVDKMKRPIPGRTYIFGEGENAVEIMGHAAGHIKGVGPHYNIQGIDWHFYFRGKEGIWDGTNNY